MEKLDGYSLPDNSTPQITIDLQPTKSLKSYPQGLVRFGSSEVVIVGEKNLAIIASLVPTSPENPINERALVDSVWGSEISSNKHKLTARVNSLHNLVSKLNSKLLRNQIPYEIIRESNRRRFDNLEVVYYFLEKEATEAIQVFPSDQSNGYEGD